MILIIISSIIDYDLIVITSGLDLMKKMRCSLTKNLGKMNLDMTNIHLNCEI